jgi:hypothetical protein
MPNKSTPRFNAEQDRSYKVDISDDGGWEIKEAAPSVKKWALLDNIDSLSVGDGVDFVTFTEYEVVGHMLPSKDGKHNEPDPVVLVEMRQAKGVTPPGAYILCFYLYPDKDVQHAGKRVKEKPKEYVLSNHWEVRSYEFFIESTPAINEVSKKVNFSRFFDYRDKKIKDVGACKTMQEIAQAVERKVCFADNRLSPADTCTDTGGAEKGEHSEAQEVGARRLGGRKTEGTLPRT